MRTLRIEFLDVSHRVLKSVVIDAEGLTSQNSQSPIIVRICHVQTDPLIEINMPPVAL